MQKIVISSLIKVKIFLLINIFKNVQKIKNYNNINQTLFNNNLNNSNPEQNHILVNNKNLNKNKILEECF